MDPVQTNKLQANLDARRLELIRSLRTIQVESRSLNRDSPRDAAEQSSSDYSKEFLLEYGNAQRRRLQLIEAALRRIEDHTFGFCHACGEEINLKRLQAVPWTPLCVACQEQLERGERAEVCVVSVVQGK